MSHVCRKIQWKEEQNDIIRAINILTYVSELFNIFNGGMYYRIFWVVAYIVYVHMYLAGISRFVCETAGREKLSSNGAS